MSSDVLPFPEVDESRVMAGDVQPDEPNQQEIHAGALNEPDKRFSIDFEGRSYSLVELPFLQSRVYADALLRPIEATLKQVVPVWSMATKSLFVLRNLNSQLVGQMQEIAKSGTREQVEDTLESLGLQDVHSDELDRLIMLAQQEQRAMFANFLAQLFSKPLITSLNSVDLTDLLMQVIDRLPEMASETIFAAVKKADGQADKRKIREVVVEKDFIDLLEVVTKQIMLYQDRGKLRSFFGLMKRAMPNTLTGMRMG